MVLVPDVYWQMSVTISTVLIIFMQLVAQINPDSKLKYCYLVC
jgi:hypothetical protein